MAASASRTPGSPPSPRSNPTITARRLRFLTETPAGAKVRRQFQQPRHVFTVEEVVESADLPWSKSWPEPTDQLWIVFVANGPARDGMQNAAAWMAPPDQPDAPLTVVVERDGKSIQWRPGRALVQGRAEDREDILAALTDFAFYEAELRSLEEAVEAREPQAREDVARAYRIRSRDRRHWNRLRETMEYFAQLRLTFARLEPRLAKGSRSLSLEARRLMARLLHKADVEARLEQLNDRLEALEDLYEGASDRISDYRWYRSGHWLEIIIIGLLALEVVLISGDMYIRYLDYKVEVASEEKAVDRSEEFRAVVTKIADGKVTFQRNVVGKDGKKVELGEEQTLQVVDNVKIAKGKLDRETREVEAGDPIAGGLTNGMFTNLGDKWLRVILVTDVTNKKVAEIYVFGSGTGRKGP